MTGSPQEDAAAGVPIQVGRYELIGELGRGGMATVHLARQLDLDRLVALKQLDGLAHETDTRVRRFVREARLAASLSHPNIVTVHDAFEVDGVPYIAMELAPGGTLREIDAGLTIEQIAGVLDGVLAGLAHAERRHIVHRDLKPENLMVTAEGQIKITDFGIAKATSLAKGDQRSLTTAGVAIGTPTYMAPEQALAEEVGPWTDLYAVGVIAFELLAGRTPFIDDTDSSVHVLLQHVNEAPPALEALRPRVDPQLAAWVARLLAKAPHDRPASASAAREELEDIILRLRGSRWRRNAPLPYVAAAPAPAPRPVRTPRRFPSPPNPAEAATVIPAPRQVRQPPPAAPAPAAVAHAQPRRPRRMAALLTCSLALVSIVIGARSLATHGVGLTGEEAASTLEPDATATPADAATPAETPAPTETPASTETPAPTPAPTVTATVGALAAQPVDSVRVQEALHEYRRFQEEAQDTEGDGDEALTQLLRNTASAYRDAARAGSAGDAAASDAAIARADQLATEAMARLEDD
jgi:hypothetical protein